MERQMTHPARTPGVRPPLCFCLTFITCVWDEMSTRRQSVGSYKEYCCMPAIRHDRRRSWSYCACSYSGSWSSATSPATSCRRAPAAERSKVTDSQRAARPGSPLEGAARRPILVTNVCCICPLCRRRLWLCCACSCWASLRPATCITHSSKRFRGAGLTRYISAFP